MNVYWTISFLMVLIQLVPVRTVKEYAFRLFFCFLILFVYSAFRVDYGLDYNVYELNYHIINSYSIYDGRLEAGYVWLNRVMPSFRWLIIVTSAFTCFAYYRFFYQFIPSKYAWFAILLIVICGDKTIFFMFSGIRNAISISILLLSIPLIVKRKFILFVLCMIIASLFHRTAYIYFPAAYLLVSNKNMTKKEFFVWTAAFCFFWLFSSTLLIEYISNFISQYLDRYDSYVDTAVELGDNRGMLIKIATLFLFFPFLFYIKRNSLSPVKNVMFRLALIFIFSYTLGALNLRTSHHFIIPFIGTLVYILQEKKYVYFKYGFLFFVLVFFYYSFFLVYLNNANFPHQDYHSILFGNP